MNQDSNKNNKSEYSDSVKYSDIKIGEDYTSIKTKLKVITNRTDLIADDPDKTDYNDYIRAFNEIYPDIEISYEAISDYDEDMTSRITSGNWGIFIQNLFQRMNLKNIWKNI